MDLGVIFLPPELGGLRGDDCLTGVEENLLDLRGSSAIDIVPEILETHPNRETGASTRGLQWVGLRSRLECVFSVVLSHRCGETTQLSGLT